MVHYNEDDHEAVARGNFERASRERAMARPLQERGSQVKAALEELSMAQEQLAKTIATLEDRLGFVLRNEPSEGEMLGTLTQDKGEGSELADHIGHFARSFRGSVAHLNKILERVDL